MFAFVTLGLVSSEPSQDIGREKRFRNDRFCVEWVVNLTQLRYFTKLECGPMPNLMVALPNIGDALCSTPQSLADAHY